jgi:hypothetical protein
MKIGLQALAAKKPQRDTGKLIPTGNYAASLFIPAY